MIGTLEYTTFFQSTLPNHWAITVYGQWGPIPKCKIRSYELRQQDARELKESDSGTEREFYIDEWGTAALIKHNNENNK